MKKRIQINEEKLDSAVKKSIKKILNEDKTSDFKEGDKVIVHCKDGDINGTISEITMNLVTWKDEASVNYEKEGKTWKMLGVPMDKMEKVD